MAHIHYLGKDMLPTIQEPSQNLVHVSRNKAKLVSLGREDLDGPGIGQISLLTDQTKCIALPQGASPLIDIGHLPRLRHPSVGHQANLLCKGRLYGKPTRATMQERQCHVGRIRGQDGEFVSYSHRPLALFLISRHSLPFS